MSVLLRLKSNADEVCADHKCKDEKPANDNQQQQMVRPDVHQLQQQMQQMQM